MDVKPSPLISTQSLGALLDDRQLRLFDCRFSLSDPDAGRRAYLEAHIPGAVYLDLEKDLSSDDGIDCGRHPLPTTAELSDRFSRWGIGAGNQVAVYDDAGGMVAARLWWMLRYMGFDAVRVLDGGWQAWLEHGGPVEQTEQKMRGPAEFAGEPREHLLVKIDQLEPDQLLDAREAARYRGQHEPIDPVAGHIPGARNHCWQENLGADGRFRSPEDLTRRLSTAFARKPDSNTTHYCGSGVSACHNVLAQVIAGLPEPRLYSGSWSEWCRDSERQVMIGPDP